MISREICDQWEPLKKRRNPMAPRFDGYRERIVPLFGEDFWGPMTTWAKVAQENPSVARCAFALG